MSEREYRPNKLKRSISAPLRVEDWEIFYKHGAGIRTFYQREDRRDAEVMFARVDGRVIYQGVTRGEKKETADRGD